MKADSHSQGQHTCSFRNLIDTSTSYYHSVFSHFSKSSNLQYSTSNEESYQFPASK